MEEKNNATVIIEEKENYSDIFVERLSALMKSKEYSMVTDGELKAKKEKKGLTNSDIANLCGVSKQTVSNWMSQKNYPEMSRVVIIANAFGVNPAWLLGLSNVTYIEKETDFDPFDKLGFSYKAWQNLKEYISVLKANGQSIDMIRENHSIRVLNTILEELHTYNRRIKIDTDNIPEDNSDIMTSEYRTERRYEFPLLKAMDNYINFDSSNLARVSKTDIAALVDKYSGAESIDGFAEDFNDICSFFTVQDLEMQYMATVQNYLKNIKVDYIREKIRRLNIELSESADSSLSETIDKLENMHHFYTGRYYKKEEE